MTTDLVEDLDRVAALTKGLDLQWPYVSEVARKASATVKELEAEVTRLQAQVRFLERKIVSNG